MVLAGDYLRSEAGYEEKFFRAPDLLLPGEHRGALRFALGPLWTRLGIDQPGARDQPSQRSDLIEK